MTAASLLDPAFVRALEHLRLEVRRRVAGARAGERRSVRRGASVEFAEHRAYAPGDDPRRIDWKAYARLGELVVRLFVAEQDVTLYVLLDASRSMAAGDAAKLEAARRMAAALGYLALTGSERVALSVARAGSAEARAPLRGRAAVPALLRALAAVEPAGAAGLAAATEALLARHARPGIAVVVSDLYEDAAVLRALGRLGAARFETTVLHVLGRDELEPAARGPVALADSETGEVLELELDAATLAVYQQRLAAWRAGLERACRERGVRYVPAFADRDPLAVVAAAVAARPVQGS